MFREFVCLAMLFVPFRASAEQEATPMPTNWFRGSVPVGTATKTVLPVSLKDAFESALRHNLGLIESHENNRAARSVRLRQLSSMLPDVSARVSATRQQIDLRGMGFDFNLPGFSLPTTIGPFDVVDARVYISQQLFNWSSIQSWRAAAAAEHATQLIYQSDRDMVITTAAFAYLAVIADHASVNAAQAQSVTAKTLYDRAIDQHAAGVVASLDVLRAQLQLQTQQQWLIAANNQLAIDKLAFARIIGLPKGQPFELTDNAPFAPLDSVTLDAALTQAYSTRPDYLAAQAQVRAAELAGQAATAARYPSVALDADYGDIGSPNFGTSHGTFSAAITVTIPIYQGTRVRAAAMQTVAALEQRRAELVALDGEIDQQVRTAFLKLISSRELVTVSENSRTVAARALDQAQDRFVAGVADNLEVVQAQEAVATTTRSYIASLYSYNTAKIAIARAIGIAETAALTYLGGK